MSSNPEKKYEILYPEDSSEIIGELMKKYGLEETVENILEKTDRREITIGEIIAGNVAEAAQKKMSFEDFASNLKKDLNISKATAEKLAEDLEQEILVKTEKIEIKEERPITPEEKEKIRLSKKTKIRPEIPIEKPMEETEKKPSKKDVYREPIE